MRYKFLAAIALFAALAAAPLGAQTAQYNSFRGLHAPADAGSRSKGSVFTHESFSAIVRDVSSRLIRENDLGGSFRIVFTVNETEGFCDVGGMPEIRIGEDFVRTYVASEASLAAYLAHEFGHILTGCSSVSQIDEIVADQKAVTLLRGAGYDAKALAVMLETFEREYRDQVKAATDTASARQSWERYAAMHTRTLIVRAKNATLTGETHRYIVTNDRTLKEVKASLRLAAEALEQQQ